MKVVLREEKKYLVDYAYFKKQSHFLSQVLMEDMYNGIEGYTIRSLYFDTIDNKDYIEKENGVEIRRKIRLRIYYPTDKYAKLEIKQKQGAYQKKRSLTVTREDAMELCKANYSVLLKYDEPFALECYSIMNEDAYRPKTIVEYKRKAFIAKENNIRVTFDSNIVATETNFDIFSENLNMNPVFDKYNIILEVKYNGFLLQYIKDIVDACDKLNLSVSKYSLARKHTMHNVFL